MASFLRSPTSILFIMGDVHDHATLLTGLAAGTEVHLIDPAGNGLVQMAAILSGRRDIGALHLVSHGAPGRLSLGSLALDADSLAWYPREWMTIRAALAADAGILLYGCEVAADGGVFADALAAACGVPVAASATLTGAAALGGDWALDYRSGSVTAPMPFSAAAMDRFAGVLTGITDGTQALSGFTISNGGTLASNGSWNVTAVNGDTAAGNQIYVDSFGGYINDATTLGSPVTSYIEIKLANTGSFYLSTAAIGDYGASATGNNFTNVYVAGYANGVQVAATPAHSSVSVNEADYHFDYTSFSGQLIDTFRVYYTTSAGDSQTAFNFASFAISGYTPVSAPSNTSPTFVGGTTSIAAAQNGTAVDVAGLLHASDSDSGQTLTWTQSSAPAHGTLSISGATAGSGSADITPGGTLSYTPAAGFAGVDTFTVQVGDATASTTRTITVNVAPAAPGTPALASGSDSGTSHGDHLTNAGTLSFSGTGGAGDSTSTVRVFIDANGNGSYDAGTDASGTATLSGGAWTVGGIGTGALGDGTYHVYAVTTSATGSLSSAASTALDVTIDKTAPTIGFGSLALSADSGTGGDFITATASQTITATLGAAPAAGDIVYGSLDNGATWTDISAMVSGTTLTWTGVTLAGSDTLKLRVTDAAGNNGTAASQAYTVDGTAPAAPTSLALDAGSDSGAPGDGIGADTTPTVRGHGEANASVTLYEGSTALGTTTADGLGNWSITSSTLTAGAHTLTATQTDVAGNLSVSSGGFAYTLDTAAPVGLGLSATTVNVTGAGSGATIATLQSSDATAVTYGFAAGTGGADADNAKFTIAGTALVAAQNLAAGTYHIVLNGTDAAGNQADQAFAITVAGAPVISAIERAGSASSIVPAASNAIGYTVKFDQAVTGVDAGDFALTATGNAGGTIASVSGSGDTYTVVVDHVAGDGTLRLDLNASGTGIQNAFGIASASGYTGGQAYQLDHTAPGAPSTPVMTAGSDSGSSGNDAVTSDTTPAFSGTAEANAGVTLYEGGTVLGTTTADGTGHWTITSSTLAAGNHALTATQTDAAGNVSAASGGLQVVIDDAAPTGVALSMGVLALAGATSGATVATLSNTDAHPDGVQYALVAGGSGADADNGKFTIAGSGLVAAQNLGAGTYHVHVQATDAAGNVSLKALAFDVVAEPAVGTIARAASASSIVPAASNAIGYTVKFDQAVTGVDAGDFALTATGNAGGTIASVSGSGDTYTVVVDHVAGDGTLRLDLNGGGTGIQNGAGIGILGGYTGGQAYQLDHTAPGAPSTPAMTAGSDSGSSGSDAVTSDTTPEFSGTAEANAGVTLYEGGTVLGTTTADGTGHWTIASSTLAAGNHALTATQTDAAGNVSAASGGLQVVIDTGAAAPTALLVTASDSGSAGDHVTNVATPTITGTAEAGATVRLYDTDGTTLLGSTTANGSGAWSITSGTLGDGNHTLTATQTDVAGNASPAGAGVALTIDTAAPSASGAPVLAAASDTGTRGDNRTTATAPVLTGSGEANAVIKLYDTDGTTVLGTTTADGAGSWSITSSALRVGQHTLTVTQTDVAGNVSAAGTPLTLSIETPPPPPAPPATTIDGVQVAAQPAQLPGGGSGTQVVIPVVTSDRSESTGSSDVADIPLATKAGANVLLAQLPTGYGLTATGGDSQPAGASLDHLLQAIVAATPGHAATDQGHLTGNGTAFLDQLAAGTPLLVQTIVPSTAGAAPDGTLTLTGTSTDEQHTALVIDATHMAAGSRLELRQVDFAAVVGAADVTGSTHGQVLSGDAAVQRFTVSAGSDSSVFSGGGNDVLAVDAATPPTGGTHAKATPQPGTIVLHGGQGADTAVFGGARADYTVENHDGYVVVTANAQPAQHTLVVNVEALAFKDTTVAVEHRADIDVIAGLYESVLGRQGDYLGVEFWATAEKSGLSLGRIALDMIASSELQARQGATFTGDAAHDVEVLYQGVFGRHGDADGVAYWAGQVAHGATLEQVAQAFVTSGEIDVHKIGVQDWDFLV